MIPDVARRNDHTLPQPPSQPRYKVRRYLLAAFSALLCWLGPQPLGGLQPLLAAPLHDQQIITVPQNKSRILDLREPIARVSVANPAIADILVINPKQLYLNGKELGTTNMTLWDDKDAVQRQIGLEVTHDLETLKEKIYRTLPGERIRVESVKGAVVLSGTASSPERMKAALTLAEAFGTQVINMLQVGGAQQVLLEVKVAEVNRTLGKTLDSNFLSIYDGGSVKVGLSHNWNRLVTPSQTGNAIGDIITDLTGTGLSSLINSGNFSAAFFLQLAEAQGQARILAEPNLTTLSGQEAEFLSGGTVTVQTPG